MEVASEKNTITGLLVGVSTAGLTLKYVREKGGEYVKHPTGELKTIPFTQIVQAIVRDVSDKAVLADRFGTDADIAQHKSGLVGRELRALGSEWTASSELLEPLEDGAQGQKWDQFAANAQFGFKGTYREELYTSALNKGSFTPAQVGSVVPCLETWIP